MKTTDIYDKYILNTYSRTPISFVQGHGSELVDENGKVYLDFFPGWGVSNIGHTHPKVVEAIQKQADKLIHVPNSFYNSLQARLAQKIVETSFNSKVFFANSGAEANEAAIKFARAYGAGTRYEIITTSGSFHGRTMGALSATGQDKIQKGFEPLLTGFRRVAFNNIQAIKSELNDKTVAIMLELVQGEGGIRIAEQEYIREIRQLCHKFDLLLIIDEVQTGIGRTGAMYAYQHYGIEPDLMTLAKSLGGGLPIGALVAKASIADTFGHGMHGSTFGGSPLICAASLAVFEAIEEEEMLENAKKIGKYFVSELNKLKEKHKIIKEVRNLGLMIGVELTIPGKDIYEKCLEKGLIINCTSENVLRLMPALNITKSQIDEGLQIIDEVMKVIA